MIPVIDIYEKAHIRALETIQKKQKSKMDDSFDDPMFLQPSALSLDIDQKEQDRLEVVSFLEQLEEQVKDSDSPIIKIFESDLKNAIRVISSPPADFSEQEIDGMVVLIKQAI